MSKRNKNRRVVRVRLHKRIRLKVSGTKECPRLCVHFSGQHIYAQLIDDIAQKTLVAVATTEKSFKGKNLRPNLKGATEVGKLIADRAKQKGVSEAVFDRGGFRYHGKVKALADAAREGGLRF